MKGLARWVRLHARLIGHVAGVDLADPCERRGEVALAIGRATVMKADRRVGVLIELEHEHLTFPAIANERLGVELYPQTFGDPTELALGVEVQRGAQPRTQRPSAPTREQRYERDVAALGAETGEVAGPMNRPGFGGGSGVLILGRDLVGLAAA